MTALVTPWLRVAVALALWLPVVGLGPALRQESGLANRGLPPGTSVDAGVTLSDLPERQPAVNADVIFDDFRYVEPVDYNGALKSGSSNSIFGPNRWLEGPDVDNLGLSSRGTRAWYGFGWQDEYVAYPHIRCRTGACLDNSLYDRNGAEVYTEPVQEAPGHVVLQYRAGAYPTDRLIGLLLTSGFASRTGTWVTRVKLPSFEGLSRGNGLGVLLAPLWLKNSTEAWETRGTWSENTAGTNWWEANIEIWREGAEWRNYADANYHPSGFPEAERYVSAGNSWFRYSGAAYEDAEGRLLPANATFGPCTVVHRSTTSPNNRQTSTLGQRDCLNAMIGTPEREAFEGLRHPYVYFMIQHTGRETRRYVYVRSEDDLGRPISTTPFESLLLDQAQSNFVDAGFFSAQLEMLLYPPDGSISTGTIEDRSLEMLFDWFLYTPDTDLTVQEAPELAGAIRQRLNRYNAGRAAEDQVWRVNTTGLALNAPVRVVDAFATCNPWRIEPTKNWDFVVEKTDRDGGTYFTVHLLRDDRHDLRRMYQSIEWRVVSNGRIVETVRNQGYTLQRGSHWGSDARFDITATVTQTSPVTHPPFEWHANHNSGTECPDSFGGATRTHTYRYDPARGLFFE